MNTEKTQKTTTTTRRTNLDATFRQRLFDWTTSRMPASHTGFVCTDIDLFFLNWKNGKLAMLEFKCRMAEPAKYQNIFLSNLDRIIKAGLRAGNVKLNYLGYFLIQFEGEFFDDGKAFCNGVEITEAGFIRKFSF